MLAQAHGRPGLYFYKIKELNPKTDFSSFEHLGIVEQLYEVFLTC